MRRAAAAYPPDDHLVGRYLLVPAAYVVLRRGEDVLLQLRRGTGYYDEHWACGAAGHVEAGESVLAAAVREAHEELAVVVRPGDLRPLTAMHRTGRTGRAVDERVDFFFECRTWQGEPTTAEAHRSAGLGWFPLTDLPAPVVPHELTVLGRLAAGDLPPITTFGY